MTPDHAPRVRPAQEHYSYAVYADPAMAEQFDRVRFGGPIGALLAEAQEQVLDDSVAVLTGATPREFADGIISTLADPAMAMALGTRAAELAATKYSYDAYLERTREVVARVTSAPRPQVAGGLA